MSHFILFILIAIFHSQTVKSVTSALVVTLSSNSPAVLGANITFVATVLNYNGGELKYSFHDNQRHIKEYILSSNTSEWVVTYPKNKFQSGNYTATVDVLQKYNIFGWFVEGTAQTTFTLTDKLNGNLTLHQNNLMRPNSFVAVNQTVNHVITLPDHEIDFLDNNSSTVIVYWFLDCKIIIMTHTLSLNHTYTDVMGDHFIDALVVADNEPLPPLTTTTSTTTTKTTTSTTTPTTTKTTTTTTTTTKPEHFDNTTTALTTLKPLMKDLNHTIRKREISIVNKCKPIQDMVCGEMTLDDCHTYGHYRQLVNVREPISSVNITGLNWLQHGDLMNLQVKYSGSPPFKYCAVYKSGQYNVTGNETCSIENTINTNAFQLIHYFSDSDQHTVVVIVENQIGKNVSRAIINIYKATIHPQLSVIVMPVVFCLLAVILIVFGVAYYQHRSRYTVEVADFDFGQQAHFDYKTFRERLHDSFRNALSLARADDTDPLMSNARYDSMT